MGVILFASIMLVCVMVGGYYFFTQKVRCQESYLMADRKTSLFPLTATLVMTELNPATLVAFTTMGYIVGGRALCLPLVFVVGLNFYAWVVAKKWKAYNGMCVSKWFQERYGTKIGGIAAISLFCAMAGFSATYVKSLGLIFQIFVPDMNAWVLTGLLTGACLLISCRGGLVALIKTDVVSFVLVLCLVPLLFYFAYQGAGHPSFSEWTLKFPDNPQDILPTKFVVSLICLTCFTYILAPWYGQKIFSAKNEKVAFQAVWLAAFIVFAIYGICLLATSLIRFQYQDLLDPQMALSLLFQQLPGVLCYFMYLVMFLFGATTLCGVWCSMATLCLAFMPTKLHSFEQKAPDREDYKLGMWISIGCALLSYILANSLVDNVFDKLILANIPVFALAFSLLAGFYWPKINTAGAWVSIIVGLFWGVGCYLFLGEEGGYTWYWGIWGVPIIFLSGVLASLGSARMVRLARVH